MASNDTKQEGDKPSTEQEESKTSTVENKQDAQEPPPKMPALKVCVCGSGESAQCLAGLAASQPDVEVRVLALNEDDASKWKKALRRNDMTLVIHERKGNVREVKAKPEIISKDPSETVAGSDFILIAASPTSHADYFNAIKSSVGKNALIVGLPGGPGFEFQCRSILADKSIPCTLMNFDNVPWNCRIEEFGLKVEFLNFRSNITGSMIRGRGICKRPPLMTLQMLHGAEPLCRQAKHHLESILMSHAYVRPAIIYGEWSRWNGKPLDQAPLFYESISKETAEMISHCSDECVQIAAAIMKKTTKKVDLSEVKNIFEWYNELAKTDVEDCTDLQTAISTNTLYKGISHQMKEVDGGKSPDFKCDALKEDIPFGTVVIKSLAKLVEVKTPTVDTLIEWCQEKMGVEFMVNGELKGKDISSTRCPQQYGFESLDSVIDCSKESYS